MNQKVRIVAFGNPLLDTVVLIKDDFLLKKYDLQADGQKEILWDEMEALKEDIKNYETSLSAGGCAQNTLKVLQWLLYKRSTATIFGAIGDDDDGKLLTKLLNKQGVDTNYIVHGNHPTGVTVAFAGGENRSLVACLGAAEVISLSDIQSHLQVASQIKDSDLVYMEGFFLTKRKEATSFILKYCNSLNKVFAFNLSGEYLCRDDPEQVMHFVENSSIVFGNKREFEALSSLVKEGNAESLVERLRKDGKTVAMTDGPHSILCTSGDVKFESKVPLLQSNEIIDTTGAGDSFVAGFLAGYLLKKPLQICVEVGCYAAQEIIKRRGCTLPEYPPKPYLVI